MDEISQLQSRIDLIRAELRRKKNREYSAGYRARLIEKTGKDAFRKKNRDYQRERNKKLRSISVEKKTSISTGRDGGVSQQQQ